MAGDDGLLAGARRTFAVAAGFSMVANMMMLAVPLFTLQVYDRVLSSRSGPTLAALLGVAVGALLVHAALEAARARLMVHVGLWLDRAWAPDLLARAIRRAPTSDGLPGAATLKDLSTVRGFVGGPGMFHLFDAPWVPIYLAVIFLLHPALGWLATAGAALLFGLAVASELATRRSLRTGGRRLAAQQQRAEDFVRRAEVIEAMGMLPALTAIWAGHAAEAQVALARGWHRAALLGAAARFCRFLVQVTVIGLGAWLAMHDALTAGGVVAGSIVLSRALAPVESLVGSWKNFIAARAALARLDEELATPMPRRGTTRLPAPDGRLALEKVTVEMPGLERPILSGVEFDLAPGESLGIVGPSAAGKSTLARVILGIQPPTRGRARLDGADVSCWCREDLGRHLGYLPQDIELFHGTVKRNIARMDIPDDALVVEAARLAGVHEMVLRLPRGYDTEIAEASRNLSGGQRQRIAIARALYGDPRLLVMDEPNSNLDAEGENALIRALMRARERKVSTVVIAHRARILMTVDKLLFLRDGRAEMFGPRDEVMARILPQPQAQSRLRPGPAPVKEIGA